MFSGSLFKKGVCFNFYGKSNFGGAAEQHLPPPARFGCPHRALQPLCHVLLLSSWLSRGGNRRKKTTLGDLCPKLSEEGKRLGASFSLPWGFPQQQKEVQDERWDGDGRLSLGDEDLQADLQKPPMGQQQLPHAGDLAEVN